VTKNGEFSVQLTAANPADDLYRLPDSHSAPSLGQSDLVLCLVGIDRIVLLLMSLFVDNKKR